MSSSVVVERLSKTYGRDVTALRDVSFRVAAGEVVSILGPNGAGKTTLLRVLMTLTHPTSGTVQILGGDVTADTVRVRREVGYVPQASTFEDYSSPNDSMMLLAQLHRVPAQERAGRIAELLTMFGLADEASRPLRQLSGGMRRRLDLAAALVHQPRVLILDEPTAALDPAARDELWCSVTDLVARRGIPVLFTTHLLEEADRFSDRVIIIDRGQLVAEGTPEKLKASLGGETISVRVSEAPSPESIDRMAAQLGACSKVQVTDRTIHVGATDAREQLWRILDGVNALGLTIEAAEMSRPSLNDVYLRATGRAYEKDGDKPPATARSPAQFWRREARA